jgi:dephospho-CoA kinase
VRFAQPVIGLTGGIGSGKSTVGRMLRDLGCLVVDADELARAALRDPEIRRVLVEWWGSSILDASGEVDRAAVAGLVFASSPQRARLESVVHPWIENRRRAMFAQAPPGSRALVIDAPLLLEAGLDRECDAIVFVDAPRELRLARLARLRGWNEAELARREESQLPLDEKRARSDYVLRNDGDLAALAGQVRRTLSKIVRPRRSRA